jgi:hypothetical protein
MQSSSAGVFRIVEALNTIEASSLGRVHFARSPLDLQRREAALIRRVVADVACPTHRADAAVIGHHRWKCRCCIGRRGRNDAAAH